MDQFSSCWAFYTSIDIHLIRMYMEWTLPQGWIIKKIFYELLLISLPKLWFIVAKIWKQLISILSFSSGTFPNYKNKKKLWTWLQFILMRIVINVHLLYLLMDVHVLDWYLLKRHCYNFCDTLSWLEVLKVTKHRQCTYTGTHAGPCTETGWWI